MKYADKEIPAKAAIPGSLIMPLMALWVSVSCSRFFGIPKIEGIPQITFERIVFILLLCGAFVSITLSKKPVRPILGAELVMWMVVGSAAVSGLAYGGFASGYAGAGIPIFLNLLLLPAVAFSVVLRTDLTTRDLGLFCLILTFFGAYLGITAILEKTSLSWMVIPPDIVNQSIEQHWGRSRGPFLQAEITATVLVQLTPATLLLASFSGGVRRVFGFVTALLLCVGCYFTETRAALLSLILIAALGSMLYSSRRRNYVALLVGLLALGYLAYSISGVIVPRLNEIDPIYDRLKLISVTFEMISRHPLTGIGFGNFDLLQEKFFDPGTLAVTRLTEGGFWAGGTHNTLLTPFAELGILPAGLFLFVVLRTLFLGFTLSLSNRQSGDIRARSLSVCSLFVCLVFLINALFVELRYSLTPNALFWVFAGFIEKRWLETRINRSKSNFV